ncbi:PGC-1 and ERR-induced regulator in muscle protein 1 isoform X1 [Sus scrofa]|uniref:PGC-1 and ERR-induced regulator in muscle protein 1 isoform X1 n=1 Tax=Sus scrofa TaxID=9823 RepID=UPI000A2B2FAC|nr:PGC-1 and ERR-induced regulator in muscle protein 1 isoform X1 [Sus scrofa]XP_020950819.1 PGC-1 and ERR-induced regulator in muscle protein 1 isoform X1 [Sus scrofa]
MENFQYSVQLSDQDWAEFSATAEECGLLQAALASGDELLSSDTDQRDNSPPGPPPLLEGQLAPGGSCQPGFEEEGKAATWQLVSRSWREPVLALEAGQQTPSTSARSDARLSLSSGAALSVRSSSLPGPASSGDEMQRLLQGSAPQGPAPSPTGEPPQSPESPSRSAAPQRPPGSPGAPPRSPSRKKRRAAGTKAGGRSGAPGSLTQLGSEVLTEARPEEGLSLAGSRGRALPAGVAKQMAGARQNELGPESAGAPERVTRQGPGVALSISVPTTEQGTDLLRMMPMAEPVSMLDLEAPRDVSMAKSRMPRSTPTSKPSAEVAQSTSASKPPAEVPQSTPASKPPPKVPQSTPASKPPAEVPQSTPASKPPAEVPQATPASKPPPKVPQSTPASKPPAEVPQSTPASKPPPEVPQSTPTSKPPPEVPQSTPASKPPPEVPQSTPASKPQLDVDLLMLGPVVKPEVDSSTAASKATPCRALPHFAPETRSEGGVSTSPVPQDWPDEVEAEAAPLAQLGLSPVPPPGVHGEKPRGEPSEGAPGYHTGEPLLGPTQASKKKKVRFSMAEPGPEKPGTGAATGPPPTTTTPRMAAGGRRGSGAWDAVAVGPRTPQPRILKHLPPPAPSASGGPAPKSCFAVTLPEAYEFFFCDTIEEEEEEEDEDAKEEAEARQALAEVRWPEVCEFFFQDCQGQRVGRQKGRSPAPPPQAKPEPVSPGDPMPISIPEAYEHFLGEDRSGGVLEQTALLQVQAMEPPSSVLWGVGTGTPPEPSPATAEQLNLAIRQAGEPRGPLTSFTFSQNDMCLVFVAFATWAVRTSDLHAPDAWKTVLLANIGTISAIRYFRRQVRRGRGSPSPSRSPSP